MSARVITAQYPGQCLTCEEQFDAGEQVNWEPGVGSWHVGCDAPRNLERERKDRDRPGGISGRESIFDRYIND